MHTRSQIFLIAGVLVVAVGIIVVAISLRTSQSSQPAFTATTAQAVSATDHVRGEASSTVSVIEYGDFECPACGQYEPIVEQLEQAYGTKVLFVFRNFPFAQIHPNAIAGAQAAEAAGLQGKYWQMHDLLFAKQSEWSVAQGSAVQQYIDNYAKSLQLDVPQFDKDMKSSEVAAKIKADMASGNAAAVDHTPTFFVNLKQIPNPSYEDFKSALDKALAS